MAEMSDAMDRCLRRLASFAVGLRLEGELEGVHTDAGIIKRTKAAMIEEDIAAARAQGAGR